MSKDKILKSNQIIKGVKPIKNKPKYGDEAFAFDKTIPLGSMNFPLTKYTDWQIYGYKKDPFTGIKRPYWMTKRLPTGRQITTKMCGLDGFFDVKPKQQVM